MVAMRRKAVAWAVAAAVGAVLALGPVSYAQPVEGGATEATVQEEAGTAARREGGVFLRQSSIDALVERLAQGTGLSAEEVRKEIEGAGIAVPGGKKAWVGGGRHAGGRHWGHRGHHWRGHHGPAFRKGPWMGPRGGHGPGRHWRHHGPGRAGARWWDGDAISEEIMTPELGAALEKVKQARAQVRERAQEVAVAWRSLAEARSEAVEAWLKAARDAGKITEEQYERMQARHERMKEAMQRRMERRTERSQEGE